MEDDTKSIYPAHWHPYYIVTPSYDPASAGVRSLHLLCHALNRAGQTAYIVQEPADADRRKPFRSGMDLLTPKLESSIAQEHLGRARAPIVIYPETVAGNPYGASCIVRYVCNFPGLLGGNRQFCSTELVYAYSQILADAAGAEDKVLFVPAIDTRIFKAAETPQPRRGSCFYADKYRKVHGGTPFEITSDSVEITRHEAGSQTPREIAALFQRSDVFYTYENTALAIEAVLCGCPAVFIPNQYLDTMIAEGELGRDGFAWGVAADDIARARATVAQGAANYETLIETFGVQLKAFITATQNHAAQCDAPLKILPLRPVAPHGSASRPKTLCLRMIGSLPVRLRLEAGKAMCAVGFRTAGVYLQRTATR